MDGSLPWLALSAAFIGLTHTAVGPDHYLPFIVLGRAEGWPLRKTLIWTALCGAGHVLSSVSLGSLGIALGWALGWMTELEQERGKLASLALIGFGLLYMLWGLWRARQGHSHEHVHANGTRHTHGHTHEQEDARPAVAHAHRLHEEPAHASAHRRTTWALMLVFVLGPCEPLIPLLMAPAAHHSSWGVVVVAGIFSVVTVGTMVALVALGAAGMRMVSMRFLERYVHALAGLAILASGLLIRLLGL